MNMKTYLSTTLLIFFLLLVDKPVSAAALRFGKIPKMEIGKEGLKVIADAAISTTLENLYKSHQQQQSPPSSTQQPEVVVIQGLSSVKSYLYNYGYLLSQTYPPSFTDDTLDDDTRQAIINYQSVFKLQTTGFPDPATIGMMLQPRCSVPDLNYGYTLDDDKSQVLSWPKGPSWSPNPRSLTYAIDRSSFSEAYAEAFSNSFQIWSKVRGVSLMEVENVEDAQIKVISYNYFNSDPIHRMEVAGSSVIQRGDPSSSGGDDNNNNNNNNNVGFIILEYRKRWVLPGGLNSVNVVMHQIGHILGLEHSLDQESIMHPIFVNPQQQTKQLSYSDKQQISRLSSGQPAAGGGFLISDKYQPAGGSGGGGSGGSGGGGSGSGGSGKVSSVGGRVGSCWGLLVATLSIGFSCMALYY